jgi:hypothetical protein
MLYIGQDLAQTIEQQNDLVQLSQGLSMLTAVEIGPGFASAQTQDQAGAF